VMASRRGERCQVSYCEDSNLDEQDFTSTINADECYTKYLALLKIRKANAVI